MSAVAVARGGKRLLVPWPNGARRCAREGEAAFTLVEVVVAMMIMMLALATLALVLTRAYASVALSGQSQQASNLGSAVIAEMESLPWAEISNGLSASDATFVGDSGASGNIVSIGGGSYCFEGLPLVVGGAAPSASGCSSASTSWYNLPSLAACENSVAPGASGSFPVYGGGYLAHQDCVDLNGTHFEVAVYPTGVGGQPLSSEVQVTVAVSWGGTGSTTSKDGTSTHVTDSAILSCGTTDGLSTTGCG
jgi:type II secretory pathway pseudopilin PulG